jgi:FAD/FMN-containing dehydrogenase
MFRGPVVVPGDDTYDAARATRPGGIDQRPAAIVEAIGPNDVRAAVVAARDLGMELAVQGTGHGTYVPADGSLLLSTRRMDGVLIDPDRRIARVGAGARWEQVIEAAAPFGLAPPSGTHGSVGVAGFTLGGGVGWLARKHGYGADNLVRAELVMADGRLVVASAEHEPELFWALRGAGRNFGVVTALEIRLAPVARVYGGTAMFPRERAHAVLAAYRELAPAYPDQLTVNVVLRGDAAGIRAVYLGAAEDGRRALQPLFDAVGTPSAHTFREMSYAETEGLGATRPRSFELFAALSDAVVEAAVTAADGDVDEIEVRHWGGATRRVEGNGPVGHRDVPFSMTIAGAAGPLAAYATGGSFLNFLHDTTATHRAYTAADLARLRELKRAYDPDNVFGRTHNIVPADGDALQAAA